ncbi:ankyrin repeat domain-containing protein [Candidatus Cardinium hertigii]|uniref:Ankyrin repeat domain-containing protein n=1 Tax=Candidatus Cardinium hertigii TaxID=247481 RepID=A0A3N2QC67_9BACT|nr:ankyrin repeat domain-containing protein [Candidatus Cardinium hertigii]ROT47413.1 ankyrin repeat domain-containing protein [Candidatus Cardinium hertigii]
MGASSSSSRENLACETSNRAIEGSKNENAIKREVKAIISLYNKMLKKPSLLNKFFENAGDFDSDNIKSAALKRYLVQGEDKGRRIPFEVIAKYCLYNSRGDEDVSDRYAIYYTLIPYFESDSLSLDSIETYFRTNASETDVNIKACVFYSAFYMLFSNSEPTKNEREKEGKKKTFRDILDFIYRQGINVDKMAIHSSNTWFMSLVAMGRECNQVGLLMLLRTYKADPFIVDSENKNALHFLLLKGHEVQRFIVDEVLKNPTTKDHINDQTKEGDTALHIACARRDIKHILALLEKGASTKIRNRNRQLPLDMLFMERVNRLEFLSNYLLIYDDDLEDVATIDDAIFDADPKEIHEQVSQFLNASKMQGK